MRFVKNLLLSPYFTLAVALVLVVLARKLSSQTASALLVVSWLLVIVSIFRTPLVSRQILIPRILFTLMLSAAVGLGLCLLAGWRPFISARPLGFSASTSDVEYPLGTKIGGISWCSRFNELRLSIINETESACSNIDLILRPDVPVVSIGQLSNFPDVTFSPADEPIVRAKLHVGATGKNLGMPLVLIASDGGYRVLCKSLPRRVD
jgi:hypothetical protein